MIVLYFYLFIIFLSGKDIKITTNFNIKNLQTNVTFQLKKIVKLLSMIDDISIYKTYEIKKKKKKCK